MSDPLLEEDDASTPLTAEEREGLIPSYITLLLIALGQQRFSWGKTNLVNPCETRRAYVAALRAADGRDIGPLLEFVRS